MFVKGHGSTLCSLHFPQQLVLSTYSLVPRIHWLCYNYTSSAMARHLHLPFKLYKLRSFTHSGSEDLARISLFFQVLWVAQKVPYRSNIPLLRSLIDVLALGMGAL